jgi:hypothetical protein
MPLTAEQLRQLINYDPDTGIFTWIRGISPQARVTPGSVAGWLGTNHYYYIKIGGQLYAAGRLAWLYMTGEWPLDEVDHRDLNSANNRWPNLRSATRSQNCANKSPMSNSTTGIKGIYFDKTRAGEKRWKAHIGINGHQRSLGWFQSADAWGEFARWS